MHHAVFGPDHKRRLDPRPVAPFLRLQLSKLPTIAKVALTNPWHTLSLLRTGLAHIPGLNLFFKNTHYYVDMHPDAVRWLMTGNDDELARAAYRAAAVAHIATTSAGRLAAA